MDREKETLDIIQGLITLVKSMQTDINELKKSLIELELKINSGRSK